MSVIRSAVTGVGSFLPEKIVTNADLAKFVDTSDEWIVERTGIRQRHQARDDEPTSDLAVEAARRALADAGKTAADVDLIIVAFACINPDFSYLLADKLLVLAEQAGIPAVICLNKIDLAPAGLVAEIEAVYKRAGYEVYAISAQQGINVGKLKDRLYGKITVFAGPSGVGKSSTLNAIEPGMQLVTGSVSEKIGRGKHTTRFAHLLPFAGGYLADTPGFGNLNLEELDDKKLAACFREFAGFEDGCKFTPCTHTHEPICGVKDALAAGEIAQSRYESYLTILEEIKSKKEKDGRK